MFIPVGTQEPRPRRLFPVLTGAMIAINVLVFVYEMNLLMTGGEEALFLFINTYGMVPALIASGRNLSTLLTSMFIHAGFAHIVFNMLFLLVFGDNVEDMLGHARFIVFYLISGLGAAFAQIAIDPLSTIPSVGASGAIAGILSGYMVFFPRGYVRTFLLIGPWARITRVPALLFIGFWFMTQFLNGLITLGVETAETGGVAYWAHIGGFIVGIALALIYRLFR